VTSTREGCRAGRRSEDGPIAKRYRLTETKSDEYAERTRLNVTNSDATLVLNRGALDGGTAKTVATAQELGKPHLVVDLDDDPDSSAKTIRLWLAETRPQVLNIAGPRESKRPGVATIARRVLGALVQQQ
jgi:hypothetical protein